MKHLKKFENIDSGIEYHVNTIKDLFQEYIDDYDIECKSIGLYRAREDNYIYYSIILAEWAESIRIVIFGENNYKFNLLIDDLEENFKHRLENIGYKVKMTPNIMNWPKLGTYRLRERQTNSFWIDIDYSNL